MVLVAARSDDFLDRVQQSIRGSGADTPTQDATDDPIELDPLVLLEDGRLRLPGNAIVVLSRHVAAGRMLRHLVAWRVNAPGLTVSAAQLFQEGWPGERIRPESARRRVQFAAATLRLQGLRGILLSRAQGYLLNPAVPVASSTPPKARTQDT